MKQEFRFNRQGRERKSLVGAISELLNAEAEYLGAPGFQYRVGGYVIDRVGAVTGAYDPSLMAGLAVRGFMPEALPVSESEPVQADVPEPTPIIEPEAAPVNETDDTYGLAISYPAEGFTDEAFANLEKMVSSKAPLLKKALGIEELPIGRGTEEITFDWFRTGYTAEETSAFAQFITCLCVTAKEKKRVTAKAPDRFENEKFALRVWLIGLGMIGKEYALARKLLLAKLWGNSSWRFGPPEKAVQQEAAPAPVAAEPESPEERLAGEPAPVETEEVGTGE